MAKKISTTSTPEEREALGARIKKVIEYLHVEQKLFAESGRISKQTISAYLAGKSQPAADVLANWVRDFQVNANWLLTGEGEMLQSDSPISRAGVPEAELSDKLTPEQRNMLTYRRLQEELGTSKERIANGLEAIVMGRPVQDKSTACTAEPPANHSHHSFSESDPDFWENI